MRVVVALGGNALLRRDESPTIEHQRANVAVAGAHLAPIAMRHELVVSHGNGPQVGLLALEAAAFERVPAYPLDVLGAETQGMLGYLIEQALADRLGTDARIATVLTMVEVDPHDPAFAEPTKPIGPVYPSSEAASLEAERGWRLHPDGDGIRRVVPSPMPRRIVEEHQIRLLVESGCIVICAGGGGVPVVAGNDGFVGVEAVVDKDHASGLLARGLAADLLVLATDVAAASLGFGTSAAQAIVAAHPDAILARYRDELAPGSMLPKVAAACDFARSTGRPAVIGALADIEALVDGAAGTRISVDVDGVVLADGGM